MTIVDPGEPAAPGAPGQRAVPGRRSRRAPARRWSLATRARLGLTIGLLLAMVAPTVAASLEQVSASMLGLAVDESVSGSVEPAADRSSEQPVEVTTRVENPSTRPAERTGSRPRDRINATLRDQASAMRAADLVGFLAPADPADTVLRGELTRRFTSLQAMRVTVWEEAVLGEPEVSPTGVSATVQLRYCFVVAACTPVSIQVDSTWTITAGHVRLRSLESSPSSQVGPRPWEVSELTAQVGNRVVVAGTQRWASRLAGVLAVAERAAAVTDRYARWTTPPSRYIVYVAGPDEWSMWYGVSQAAWVAAYAMPLTDSYTEIVLNANKVGAADAREVLQHEFTHVVTLAGVRRTYPDSWWLVEGISEYVQNLGRPTSGYRALPDGRRYARSGAWDGSVALSEPDAKATTSEANGHYAVAFLAVRRLTERFGETKMLDFFAAVARDGKGLTAASAEVLAVPWTEASADCAQAVSRGLSLDPGGDRSDR